MLTKVSTGAAFLRCITHIAGKDMLSLEAAEGGVEVGAMLVVLGFLAVAVQSLL